MSGTPKPTSISTKQDRIAKLAQRLLSKRVSDGVITPCTAQRSTDKRSRMREICTSGSVGGRPARQTLSGVSRCLPTRPSARNDGVEAPYHHSEQRPV
jgi:hypothetical protein